MSTQLISSNHVLSYTSDQKLNNEELDVLHALLAAVSKVEKDAETYFSVIRQFPGNTDRSAWECSWDQALKDLCKDYGLAPQYDFIESCSGSVTINQSDNIYDKALAIASQVSMELAAAQIAGINDYVNSNNIADSIAGILKSWRDNWLEPVGGIQLFCIGPSDKTFVGGSYKDAWSCKLVTVLTIFTFQSEMFISASDVFKLVPLDDMVLKYMTVKFSTPALDFSWDSMTTNTALYIENIKSSFACDPATEVKSAPLA